MTRFRFLCLFLTVLALTSCSQNNRSDQPGRLGNTNEVALTNLNLGIQYMQNREYEKALENLNKSLAADPNYTPTYNALGVLYQRLGKNEQAEQYFKKALGINANDPHTLNNYGQYLCTTNRYDEAQALFKKAAANPLYETPEIALTNAGTCALNNNHPDIAETHFKMALEKNPRNPTALLQMSQISYTNGDFPSAQAYFKRYLGISSHTPASLWLGIQIEQKLGDKNALSSYALLLKNNYPESREAGLLKESGLK